MSPTDPSTWQCPSVWHADLDGEWEFSQLRALAIVVIGRPGGCSVRLSYTDPTAVHFDVFKGEMKIGEAYVNRQEPSGSTPRYSVYTGSDQAECHGGSITDASEHIENAVGEWRDE